MALTKKDLRLIREIVHKEVHIEIKPFRGEILQFKDDILTEVRSLREEMSIVVGYRGLIENHEERLEVVETRLNIPSA